LFDSEENMVRIDMSEYMEKHAVSRLIGAPPGYIGFEEGGQLTEAVRRHPYSVVLLDEVEKAHPDVMNVLLQLLDDGRLTDGRGRVVDFSNTVVILTSNLCQDERYELENGATESAILQGLHGHFRPEFLNRLDSFVRFNSLSAELIAGIVRLELKKVNRDLEEQELKLEVTEAAVQRLAIEGFDPQFGARPVKRVIQREVQDRLADMILAGELKPENTVVLDVDENGFVMMF